MSGLSKTWRIVRIRAEPFGHLATRSNNRTLEVIARAVLRRGKRNGQSKQMSRTASGDETSET
jgi:hypothetical protein